MLVNLVTILKPHGTFRKSKHHGSKVEDCLIVTYSKYYTRKNPSASLISIVPASSTHNDVIEESLFKLLDSCRKQGNNHELRPKETNYP